MTDPIIERLRAVEAKINAAGGFGSVAISVSPRRVSARSYGTPYISDVDGLTVEEVLAEFEAKVARALCSDLALARTLGLEAAE